MVYIRKAQKPTTHAFRAAFEQTIALNCNVLDRRFGVIKRLQEETIDKIQLPHLGLLCRI